MSRATIFEGIYDGNLWGGSESRSGTGSDSSQTKIVRKELPGLFKILEVGSVLDIPVGDFNWMQQVNVPKHIKYIGADVVPKIIADNQAKYPDVDFRVLDIVSDQLPKSDMVFTRDCLGHLSNSEVRAALENIKRSGAKYLVSTTFPKTSKTLDISTGGWRPINLEHFGFKPIMTVNEGLVNDEGIAVGKFLGVYRLDWSWPER